MGSDGNLSLKHFLLSIEEISRGSLSVHLVSISNMYVTIDVEPILYMCSKHRLHAGEYPGYNHVQYN